MPGWVVAGDIGKRLLDLREYLGEGQRDFAARFGRTWKRVSAWENGDARPPQSALEKAARDAEWPIEIFSEGGRYPKQALKPLIRPAKPSNGDEGTPGARSRAPGRRKEDREGDLRAKAARLEVILATLKVYRDRGLMPGPGIIDDWLENRDEPSPPDPGSDGDSPPG